MYTILYGKHVQESLATPASKKKSHSSKILVLSHVSVEDVYCMEGHSVKRTLLKPKFDRK